MKSSPFRYHVPATTADVVDLLDEYPDAATILAGGQSLVPLLSLRLAHAEHLIDLNHIDDLAYVRNAQDDGLTIGAMTRQRTVERSHEVAAKLPILQEALSYVGHTQIRNRGTVVGSICHADPSAELPAVWLALGGEATVVSSAGTRHVYAEDFFKSHFTTCIEANELVTEIKFDVVASGTGRSVHEVARRHGDFALVGVVAQVSLDAARENVIDARIALYGVGATPVRATRAEELLGGLPATGASWEEAAAVVKADVPERSDVHASAGYRRSVAGVLTRRALSDASVRALVR